MRHRYRADRFFTTEEKERIRRATVDTESRTVGEIAVAVIDHSSPYLESEVIGGMFVSGIVSLVLTVVLFHSSIWSYIPLSFVLFFPARHFFRKMPAAKRIFTGRARRERAVRERALKAFYERGLYKTKHNTGVLFFLSLFERKVWVLADKGIHGKIHQNTLNGFANGVSKGIAAGRACDALVEAIHGMGDILAEHYPVTADDTDELTDEVICEPDRDPCD
jgi:putative membrane protein